RQMAEQMKALSDAVNDFTSPASDPEYGYKMGDLLHWMESVVAAVEMWAVTENDHYLNAVVQQWNKFTTAYNNVVSEGALDVDFMQPLHHLPLPDVDDPQAFLLELARVEDHVGEMRLAGAPGAD
ncbi:MAG: hypothetical protein AAF125_13710, partial [Chloroflexota bacterium]